MDNSGYWERFILNESGLPMATGWSQWFTMIPTCWAGRLGGLLMSVSPIWMSQAYWVIQPLFARIGIDVNYHQPIINSNHQPITVIKHQPSLNHPLTSLHHHSTHPSTSGSNGLSRLQVMRPEPFHETRRRNLELWPMTSWLMEVDWKVSVKKPGLSRCKEVEYKLKPGEKIMFLQGINPLMSLSTQLTHWFSMV